MPDKSFSNTIHFIRKLLPAAASLLTSGGILYGAYSVYHTNDATNLLPPPTTALPDTGAINPHPTNQTRAHSWDHHGGYVAPPDKTAVKLAKQLGSEAETSGESDNRSQAHGAPSSTAPETAQRPTSKSAQTSWSETSETGKTNPKPALAATNSAPTPSAKNIGFAPVQGGRIKSLAHAPKNAGTLSASVIQYGGLPETTSSGTIVKIPGVGKVSLPTLTSGTYLYLPLKHGLLWAVIPPTTESMSGLLGESFERTPIFYTAYPSIETQATLALENTQTETNNRASIVSPASSGQIHSTSQNADDGKAAQTSQTALASSAAQTSQTALANSSAQTSQTTLASSTAQTNQTTPPDTHAPIQLLRETELLGELPRTASPTGSWKEHSLSWFHPSQNSVQKALEPFVQLDGVPANRKTPGSGMREVQLQSFYRIYQGALFVLAFHKDNRTLNEVVQWNVRHNTLTPLAWLPNGGDSFSWMAVSPSALYDEVRRVRKTVPTAFRGHQEYINLQTDHIYPIRLGHWSDGGVGSGTSLAFEVDDSANWELFTPTSTPHRLLSKNGVQTSH
jgi:hypothetical protein